MSSSSVPRSIPEEQDGAKETPKIHYLSRREMLGLMGSASIAVTLAGCGAEQSGSSSSPSASTAETTSASLPIPEGPGSVSGAPNLPDGFTDTFTGRYVDTGELRLHAVIGGAGHWVAEQAPEEMVAALTEFLNPYREGGGGSR